MAEKAMDSAIGAPRAVPFSKKTGALFTNAVRNRCMRSLLRLSRAKLPSLKVARNTPFRSLSERLMSSGAKESADKLLSRMISIARKEGYPVKDGVKCQTLLLAFMISSHKSFSFAVEVERGLEQAVSDASVALVEWMEESAAGVCDCTILPKLLSTYLDAVDPWIAETGRVVSDMKGQMMIKLDRVLSSPVRASTRHVMQRHRAGIVSSLPVDASARDPLLFFVSSGMREQIGHEVLLGNDIKHSHVGNIFDANFWTLLHADLTKNPVIVTRVNLVAADIQKKLVNLSIALDTAVPDVAGILSHDFPGQRRIFDNVFALLREIHGVASADVFDTIDHDALASLGYWSSGILGLALNIMWSRADYMHKFEQKARYQTLRGMLQCSGVEWESSKFTKLLNRGLISLDSTREWLSRAEGNSWEEIVRNSWVGLIASDDVSLDQLPEVCRLDWRRITDLRKAFFSDSLAKVVVDAVRFDLGGASVVLEQRICTAVIEKPNDLWSTLMGVVGIGHGERTESLFVSSPREPDRQWLSKLWCQEVEGSYEGAQGSEGLFERHCRTRAKTLREVVAVSLKVHASRYMQIIQGDPSL